MMDKRWRAAIVAYGREFLLFGLKGWLESADTGDREGSRMAKSYLKMVASKRKCFETGLFLKGGTETGVKGLSSWGLDAPEAALSDDCAVLGPDTAEKIAIRFGADLVWLYEGQTKLWGTQMFEKGKPVKGTRFKHSDIGAAATASMATWFEKRRKTI